MFSHVAESSAKKLKFGQRDSEPNRRFWHNLLFIGWTFLKMAKLFGATGRNMHWPAWQLWGGKGCELTLCLRIEILWSMGGQPHFWVDCNPQSTYIYRAQQCMSPRRNWDSPNPSPVSECAPPRTKGWGAHSRAAKGVGGPNSVPTTGEKAHHSAYSVL